MPSGLQVERRIKDWVREVIKEELKVEVETQEEVVYGETDYWTRSRVTVKLFLGDELIYESVS